MAVTEQSYTGNGSTTNYSFTFPYLKSTDVQVQVDAAVTTAWTFANATTVQFNTAPANGAAIKILRDTNVDNLTATFYAGSAIKSEDLNDNFTQNLYVTQEVGNRSFENTGTSTMIGNLNMGEDTKIIFEGATDNAHETTLTVADPTADRTITLPNATGTIITTGDTGTVTHAMLAGDAVDGDNIGDDVINSEHIAAGAVDLEHMSANSVDSDQYVDGSIDHVHLANDVIDGDNIQDDVINSEHIAAGAVDLEHMSANSVDSDQYVDGSIDGVHIANDQIDSQHYAAGSIDLEHMSANSVDSDQYVDGSIDSAHIANDQIDSQHYAAGSIDLEHMSANSVDSDQYVDGSIDRVHLAADIVDGTKIADDAIGAEHIQANAVGTSEIADAELVTLAGMPSATASILADSTALTSTTAELNLLDGKSIVTSVSGSSTDVQLPTAKAVNDQIVATLQDVGGFYPIDDELKFPNTNPDPNDDAGTIVSIADAGGIVVNGSGVSTTGRTLGGATVTINGIDSSLHSTTIAAGKGMLVQTTSTLNTYTYHRLVVDEAGVASAQALVSDFNDRYQVASSAPSNHPDGSALADGDLWFDTAANVMKVYDLGNTSYGAVTSVGDYKLLTVVPDGATSGSPNYTNTSFDLRDGSNAASITSVGQLLVSVNGVLQKPNAGSYSSSEEGFYLEGTNGIKFCTAPGSGASVFVTLIGSATSVNVPATNSIVESAIQTNVVSEGKLKITNSPSAGKFLQTDGSGNMSWQDATTPVLTSRGDILTRSASAETRLALGTNGQTLQSNGTDIVWADSAAGATGGNNGANKIFWENEQTVTHDYTITAARNAGSFGPITINNGVTVTIPNNSNWTII